MLEEERPALGDRVVADAPLSTGRIGGGVGEVLGVAGLVEERPPVVGAAHRLDHEHRPCRAPRSARRTPAATSSCAARRRARRSPARPGRSRALPASPRARGACARTGTAGSHSVARSIRDDVPALGLGERHADRARGRAVVDGVLEQPLGVGEEACGTGGELLEPEAEAPVEVERSSRRRGRARPVAGSRRRLEVDRVEVLVGRARSARCSRRARLSRSGSLAIAGRSIRKLIVSPSTVDLERRLELADLRLLALRQVAEIAAAGEAPQLRTPPVAVDGRADRPGRSSVVRSANSLVDRLDLELVLQAREMEVELRRASPPRTGRRGRGRRQSAGWADGSATRRRIARCGRSPSGPSGGPSSSRSPTRCGRALDGSERRLGRARLRAAHDGRRDDQRAHRPDGGATTSRTRCRRSSTTAGAGVHEDQDGPNAPFARARLADRPAGARPGPRRRARARHLAGHLLLRVRRSARPQGLSDATLVAS